ncbi:hypothetical protein ES703_101971 [subsurface metagenome]
MPVGVVDRYILLLKDPEAASPRFFTVKLTDMLSPVSAHEGALPEVTVRSGSVVGVPR